MCKRKDQDWMDLYAWIEREIMGYDSNQKLQKAAVLRIRGLAHGQSVANNKQDQYGDYSAEVILLTFKANKSLILNALRGKNFDSENGKIGYCCAIVRDRINDIYTRLNNAKKSQEKIEEVNTSIIDYEGAGYKTKANKNNKNEDKFKELW